MLTGVIKDDGECPKCGSVKGEMLFCPPKLPDTVYTNFEDQALKDQFALGVKKHVEANADKIRSGEMDVKGSNPVGFEPELGKRFY